MSQEPADISVNFRRHAIYGLDENGEHLVQSPMHSSSGPCHPGARGHEKVEMRKAKEEKEKEKKREEEEGGEVVVGEDHVW